MKICLSCHTIVLCDFEKFRSYIFGVEADLCWNVSYDSMDGPRRQHKMLQVRKDGKMKEHASIQFVLQLSTGPTCRDGNVDTLPETNSSPLKLDGWNTTFLLGRPIFRCYVSFRESNWSRKSLIKSFRQKLRFKRGLIRK